MERAELIAQTGRSGEYDPNRLEALFSHEHGQITGIELEQVMWRRGRRPRYAEYFIEDEYRLRPPAVDIGRRYGDDAVPLEEARAGPYEIARTVGMLDNVAEIYGVEAPSFEWTCFQKSMIYLESIVGGHIRGALVDLDAARRESSLFRPVHELAVGTADIEQDASGLRPNKEVKSFARPLIWRRNREIRPLITLISGFVGVYVIFQPFGRRLREYEREPAVWTGIFVETVLVHEEISRSRADVAEGLHDGFM